MLCKLKHLGFKEQTVSWFRSYLTGRTQSTKMGTITSKLAPVTYGVPQGSILGPLLFTLYVNDLPKVVNDGFISLYADDTAICIADNNAESMQRRLDRTLETVVKWFNQNKLSANLKETKLMFFGTRTTLQNMDEVKTGIGEETLETVQTFKYLGV